MIKAKNILITKASGESVPFQEDKLRHSLSRSGAPNDLIDSVVNKIKAELKSGMTTKELYKSAFNLLRKSSRPSAARYKLKKAIYELGPSGFPFEKYVGAILAYEGFDTKVGVIVRGKCVNHEVDVVAEKDEEHFMVECKFHHKQGINCNVKIPLYIKSRFLDVQEQWQKRKGHETKFHQGWIFTNTRFTTDAIKFGNCAGLQLVGWNYPKDGSLNQRIDESGLHPLTCLTTISIAEKQKLLNEDIVLCMELCDKPNLLKTVGIDETRHNKILNEAHELCGM